MRRKERSRKKEIGWHDREERTKSEKDRNEYKRKTGLRLNYDWQRTNEYNVNKMDRKRKRREGIKLRKEVGRKKRRKYKNWVLIYSRGISRSCQFDEYFLPNYTFLLFFLFFSKIQVYGYATYLLLHYWRM